MITTKQYFFIVLNVYFIMEHILKELGLTHLEIKLYKFLLLDGPNHAGLISRKTGVHRRNVYDALERLIQKGLVSYIK